MTTTIVPWQRFWLPLGHSLPLSEGYLRDPESEPASGSALLPLTALLSTHCVALLGEPGMGKTTTLKHERESVRQHCDRIGARLLWHDLASFGDESRLVRTLFENEKLQQWKRGTHALYLVLDSFDECHLRIETLSNLLLEELRELPTERLFLFIACRPAHWPRHLEKGLKDLWGEKGFVAAELAPLRERDVQEFVHARGVEPEAFLAEVTYRQAMFLASRPVTLGFLVEAFKRGKLSVDRWQLYFDGCRYLAQENNDAREESGLRSDLGPGERLTVASRIAALTLLSNRDKIWLGRPDEELPDSVLLEELSGEVEVLDNAQTLSITTEALRETLDSGLFGARGSRLVGWAHRTYAEFLTALFLRRRKVSRVQLVSLLRHPEDTSRRVVPQLYEVAAWLATQDEELRDLLLETDPWVLLHGDAFTMNDEIRARLTESILGALARGDALSGEDSWLHFHKLAHPGLGAQLRSHLRGASSLAASRVFIHVLNIARSCEESSLAPELAEIALDESQPLNHRTGALRALRSLGDAATKARFLPLALSGEGDDPEGHLRDNALSMLWPEHVSTEQVFQFLRERSGRPRREVGYVWEALDRRLTPAELPMALRWVVEEEVRHGWRISVQSSLQGLENDLMRKGWTHLLAPGVRGPFCSAVWARLKKRGQDVLPRPPLEETPSNEWVAGGDEKRWHLIEALAASREQPEDLLELEQVRPPLFLARDFPRLLERARKENSPEEQERWALLAVHVFSFEEPSHLDTVFEAAEHCPPIANAFSWLLDPVKLDSPDVEEERARYRQQVQARAETQRLIQECEQFLQRIESGDVRPWAHLVQKLLPPDDEGMDLIGSSEHWPHLPEEVRARIVRAAHRFLLDCSPTAEPWLEGGAIPWIAASGYAAFMLLARAEPGLLESLPESVWMHWASLILVFPSRPQAGMPEEQRAFRKSVVDLAAQHAPVDVMRSFRRMLAPENQGQRSFEFILGLHGCWNGLLLDRAWDALRSAWISRPLFGLLLKVLLAHQHSEARAHAESLLLSTREVPPELKTVTASVLLTGAPESTWSRIWPLLLSDLDYGRRVLEGIAGNGGELAISAGMFTPEQLVDIYIWIERHGGPEAPRRGHPLWARPEGLHALKGLIWAVLVNVGSPEACRALERLNRELPGQELLQLLLLRAQEALRLREWQPPSPREILNLVSSQQARFVGSGTQLLDVLLESLARLQDELHGETPALKFLWNESRAGTGTAPEYRPKKENDLSDWIKHHLEKDLADKRIIVNREVEIRPSEPSRTGQRTDLLVEAIARLPDGGEERVSVIIEVKGCWNRDLWRAMREQLVARYLAENTCQQGIYLVGWYACDYWDETTPNPAEESVPSLVRARQLLEEQARQLSQEGVQVRAFVLDAAFRTERASRGRR